MSKLDKLRGVLDKIDDIDRALDECNKTLSAIRKKEEIIIGGYYTRIYHLFTLMRLDKEDMKVIDRTCQCETCQGGHTRSYLNYLFKMNEPLGATLLSLHNIYFMNDLMEAIRESIRNNTIDEEESKWLVNELKYQNRKSMNIASD